MNIWVDADACPVPIKEIIFRAAKRTGLKAIFVANHTIKIPKAPNIVFKLVASGFDQADDYISESAESGNLVITNDIPLASTCIDKGCLVINSKGELLTKENVKERLNMRDFMETMRASGIQTGGPPPLSNRDIKTFSDSFDRQITLYLNSSNN